jgi:hypothetical protein
MKKQALLVAILCVSVFSTVAFAAGKKAPGPNTQGVQVAQTLAPTSVKHILKGTYISSGVINFTLPAATFTALDGAQTAVCPQVTPCTLIASMFATSGLDSAGGNRALCLSVNGGIVGACPYSGRSATDNSFSQFGTQDIAVSFTGSISVQTLAFSDTGATVYMFSTTYAVYKP